VNHTVHSLLLFLKNNNNFSSNENKNISYNSKINIENLYFKYDSNFILNNLNLEVEKGKSVVLIGETGSGKSTLIDILMGLLTKYDGVVKIDNKILDNQSLESWRSKVAHVPQMVYLIDSTLIENIAFGVPPDEVDNILLEKAINISQLDEVIKRNQFGLFQNVGEGGSKLSGGEKQRVGIARAIYKNAEIYFFDEATSALDELTENKILNQIKKLMPNITAFYITHRINTFNYYDSVYEIKNGKIFEFKFKEPRKIVNSNLEKRK
jgi:ATP-binding cassette subfamily B protein